MKNTIGILCLLICLLFASCRQHVKYIENQGLALGTIYNISYLHPERKDLQTDIDSLLQLVNYSLSPFISNSTISKINNNKPVQLDQMFIKVFIEAQNVSEITNGAFDITVAPLVNAWGFGFRKKEKITPELIDSIMNFVGFRNVKLEDGLIIKQNQHTMLDCSSIAKGFAVDMVGDFLAKQGCENYMVDIGGEVITRGLSSRGDIWRIGISTPKEDNLTNESIQTIVTLQNKALATSGNYRNFYEEEGKKYVHTIDPRLGYPTQHNLLSATIMTNNCIQADAYATACMVMGLEKSYALIEKLAHVEAYFIYSDENGNFATKKTSGFKVVN